MPKKYNSSVASSIISLGSLDGNDSIDLNRPLQSALKEEGSLPDAKKLSKRKIEKERIKLELQFIDNNYTLFIRRSDFGRLEVGDIMDEKNDINRIKTEGLRINIDDTGMSTDTTPTSGEWSGESPGRKSSRKARAVSVNEKYSKGSPDGVIRRPHSPLHIDSSSVIQLSKSKEIFTSPVRNGPSPLSNKPFSIPNVSTHDST